MIGYYLHYVNSSPLNWKQYRFVSEETKQKTRKWQQSLVQQYLMVSYSISLTSYSNANNQNTTLCLRKLSSTKITTWTMKHQTLWSACSSACVILKQWFISVSMSVKCLLLRLRKVHCQVCLQPLTLSIHGLHSTGAPVLFFCKTRKQTHLFLLVGKKLLQILYFFFIDPWKASSLSA